MRDFTGMPALLDADALLSFMQEAPTGRVLMYGDDLDPSEFDGPFATRADIRVLAVYSMSEVGASSIRELCHAITLQQYQEGPYKGEIAVIGEPEIRSATGRSIPKCIQVLMDKAEDKAQGRKLAWAGYEGICVLPEHPEAEG